MARMSRLKLVMTMTNFSSTTLLAARGDDADVDYAVYIDEVNGRATDLIILITGSASACTNL